jgi:hypothetical protein
MQGARCRRIWPWERQQAENAVDARHPPQKKPPPAPGNDHPAPRFRGIGQSWRRRATAARPGSPRSPPGHRPGPPPGHPFALRHLPGVAAFLQHSGEQFTGRAEQHFRLSFTPELRQPGGGSLLLGLTAC